MIEFPIYRFNNTNSIVREILFAGSIVAILYILFPQIDIRLLLIPLVAFIFYKVAKHDKNEPIGKIHLTNHQIQVTSETDNFRVDISLLNKLELIYSGFRGQRLKGDIIGPYNKFSGIDNYLILIKNGSEFKCRFLVKNQEEENILIEVIQNWEVFGYDTTNIKINM